MMRRFLLFAFDRVQLQKILFVSLVLAYITWPFYGFEITHFWGFGLAWTSFFQFCALIDCGLLAFISFRQFHLHRLSYWILLLLFSVSLALISIVFDGAKYLEKTMRTTTHLLVLIGVMFAFAIMDEPPKKILVIFRLWIWLSIPICLFGIYQIFARAFHLPFAWLELNNVMLSFGHVREHDSQLSLQFGQFFRATSVLPEPGILGAYCNSTLVLLGSAIVSDRGDIYIKSGIGRIAVVVLLMVTIFLTYSLGTLINATAILIMITFAADRQLRWRFVRNVFIGIIVFVSLDYGILKNTLGLSITELTYERASRVFLSQTSGNNNLLMGGESFDTRWSSIKDGARIWMDYPIVGAGLGRYTELSHAELYNDTFYFRVLSELGFVGLLVMVGFILTVAYRLYRLSRSLRLRSPELVLVRTLMFLMLMHLLTGWMGDFLHFDMFWMNIGIALLVLKKLSPATETVQVVLG